MKNLLAGLLAFALILLVLPAMAQENPAVKDPVSGKMIKQPQFPGGDEIFMKFLSTNMRYPDEARKKRTKGLVVLQFLVDSTGQIRNISVIKPLNPSMDAEAIRVVESMPLWEPGEKDGKPADMDFTLPLRFSIR